jgi:ATP-binding cassette subfamily B protein
LTKTLTSPHYRALLGTYLRPLWPRVLVMASLLLTSIGLQLLYPRLLQRFIDHLVSGAPVDGLYRMGLVFLVAALTSQMVSVLAGYASGDVGWRATNRLRSDLLDHVLHLYMSFHTTYTPGELIQRIDGDVSHLANFLSRFAGRIAGGVLLLIGVLTVVSLDDWRLGLMMGAFAAVYALSHITGSNVRSNDGRCPGGHSGVYVDECLVPWCEHVVAASQHRPLYFEGPRAPAG